MGQTQPAAPDGVTGTSVPVVPVKPVALAAPGRGDDLQVARGAQRLLAVHAARGPDESRTTMHQSEPKETLDDHA
jgi:hypothetical protein